MLIGDSAYPLAVYPTSWKGQPIVGWGFYIGGNTPHVWTLAEIANLKKHYRYLLPIFTRSDPQNANASTDVNNALEQLHNIGVPNTFGYLVQWDYETAVNSSYELACDAVLRKNGYSLELYGSSSTVVLNAIPSGGYDKADWTGSDYAPSSTADQFVDVGPYDLNDFRSTAPLWDTQRPVVVPPPPVPPTPTEEDVLYIISVTGVKEIYGMSGGRLWHINDPEDLLVWEKTPNVVKLTVSQAELANLKTPL